MLCIKHAMIFPNKSQGPGPRRVLKHSLYVFHVKFGMRWRSDNKSGHTKGEGGKFASLVRTASNPCRRTSLQRRKKIFLFHALNSFHWIHTNRRKGLLNNQHLRNRILLLLLVGFKHIYFSTKEAIALCSGPVSGIWPAVVPTRWDPTHGDTYAVYLWATLLAILAVPIASLAPALFAIFKVTVKQKYLYLKFFPRGWGRQLTT